MPELPEVETVVRYLNKNILNKEIVEIIIHKEKIIKNIDKNGFINFLINEKILKVERKAKYIIFVFSNNKNMISHLRMEGKFFVEKNDSELIKNKHSHILFKFKDGEYLIYNDTRIFGTMNIYSKEEMINNKELIRVGYEPFDENCNVDYLFQIFKKSNRKIKTILLDQGIISGIGNIYADEILFQAKILPFREAKSLNKNDIDNILSASIEILNKSILNKGTTIHSFKSNSLETGNYQQFLKVHTKKDEECLICKDKIIKIKVNNRGTYYCKTCQN
jgi:formamidopyrimidine-DNA glycosylase